MATVSQKLTLILLSLSTAAWAAGSPEKAWQTYSESFLDSLWQLNPVWSTQVGYHKYDDRLPSPTAEHYQNQLTSYQSLLKKLKKINPSQLPLTEKTDYQLIENFLNYRLWSLTEFKDYQWNPAVYNVGGALAAILESSKLTSDEKQKSILKRLRKVPSYYQAAVSNISKPTKEHLELGIQQNRGLNPLFTDTLPKRCKTWFPVSKKEQDCLTVVKTAHSSIGKYINQLEAILNNGKAKRSFRLGKQLYQKKFALQIQSGLTAEQVYRRAVDRKNQLHKDMLPLAHKLWDKYLKGEKKPKSDLQLIRRVIDRLSLIHAKPDDFISAIRNQIPELEAFVVKKNLISLDPSKALKVRETPAYSRGVAAASIDAPGPYDPKRQTFYNVSPLTNKSKEQAKSYLREYNKYILQILNIHEAVPGHYTQLVYSNNAASLVKRILSNGAMIEGWAVYAEKMLLEEGYGKQRDELLFSYYKWHLRVVCNTILDYAVHNLEMSRKDGLNLLINEAFQQREEAVGKWRRVSLTQVQLTSYFTGFTEIYQLRQDIKKAQGTSFNLKTFHETFLSFGSIPVKSIKALMGQDLKI